MHRRCKLTDAVPYDPDALDPFPVNSHCLMDVHLLDKLPEQFGCQFPDIGVFPHQGNESVHIDVGFLF